MNNNILFPKLLGTYKPKADREECGTPVTAERVFGGDDTTEGEKTVTLQKKYRDDIRSPERDSPVC